MASASAASLNAEAPAFYPTKINKLQPAQQHSNYYTYSPRLPPYPYFVYNTAIKHPLYSTSFSFHFHHPNHQTTLPTFPILDSEPKVTHFHEPFGLPKHELVKEVVSVEESRDQGNDSKVFKIINEGGMEDRRSDGMRFHGGYVWRRKGSAKDEDYVAGENDQKFQHKSFFRKNRQHRRHFRAFHDHHNNRAGFPVVPVRPDGVETTVMIKNIPSKYTRGMLVDFLENHCMVENAKDRENGEQNTFAFDFVYLPIDFRTGLNKGYAFVNFTKSKAAWKFLLTVSDQKWELFLSNKIRHVVAARLQGKQKLEKHFESMSFPCESEEVLPLSFDPPRDGVIKGDHKTIGRLFKPTFPLYY